MTLDVLSFPRWRSEDLGLPMPDDPHAVSACLPLWSHNIGYEEGDPAVHEQLKAAYPRFCIHPLVQQLCDQRLTSPGRRGLPFVSAAAAGRAQSYVRHYGADTSELRPLDAAGACGVIVDESDFGLLKQFWQHAGENVSSRVAVQIMAGDYSAPTESSARTAVRQTMAEWQQVTADRVFLFPSGMAAVSAAWRAVMGSQPGDVRSGAGQSCQFGFPYVDTLKIQERFPDARHTFFAVGGADDLRNLRAQCEQEPPRAIFCEVPTNPLLRTPDLAELRKIADQFDAILIVDDTLGACVNLDVSPYADLIVTSLTKYFSGYGNVLAGSLIVNPDRPRAEELQQRVAADFEETLSDTDVMVLHDNSQDLVSRIEIINRNASRLAAWLNEQSAVESVYYPTADDSAYELIRRAEGGYGGLLSLVMKNPVQATIPFFDHLRVCKGPNLGTRFTLCCPFTILAHYDELDAVEECGVSRWLLRVSVGIEDYADLQQRFEHAFAAGG